MTIQLPPLPYDLQALEPFVSQRTLEFHHGKHHQAYVNNLNTLIASSPLEKESLEDIILASARQPGKEGIFNNAAQVWNHTFFWNSMKPQGGGVPSGDVATLIHKDFGSFDAFKEEFKKAAVSQFGSGWAWLVFHDGKVSITKTPNADLPLAQGHKALLTCDVWEHAYYLDYQNRRPDYVETFLTHLVNWEFVERNLQGAK